MREKERESQSASQTDRQSERDRDFIQTTESSVSLWEAGIAQWLKHWTFDQKVVGLSPDRRISVSGVNFLCRLLF